MTIPNLITSIRIILAPIFVIYLINERFSSALIVFILAGLSDGADGLIARLFGQKSRLGTFLDPLADKILLIAAFVTLAIINRIPPWLSVIVISRDVLILLGALILFLNNSHLTIRPSILSKMTTCLQLLTVFLVLAKEYVGIFMQFSHYILMLTGLLTISSGLHYMRYWFKMMGEESKIGS